MFPAIAIVCGVVCLAAVVYFNQLLSLIFLGLMAVWATLYFRLTAAQRDAAPHDAMLADCGRMKSTGVTPTRTEEPMT